MNTNSATILCEHIALGSAPIKFAIRTAPLQPEDSGWQFLCGSVDENPDKALVWSMGEVIERFPNVTQIVEEPPESSFEYLPNPDASGLSWRRIKTR